jgi:hypothetical protein
MTTSLNSPTVVKSAPQPIDLIPGPKPDLRTAIARPIREVIKQELTTDLVSDLRLSALAASAHSQGQSMHSQRQSMKIARPHTHKCESKPIAAAAPAPFSYRCTQVTAAKLALATVQLERGRGRDRGRSSAYWSALRYLN